MLYAKKFSSQNSNDSSSLLYSFVDNNSIVLDVGCACGDLGAALVEDKNCELYGLEYNSQSVEICIQRKVFKRVDVCNLNELTANSYPEYISKFDYIICGDVLEHLLFPDLVLQVLKKYLRTNGRILISLPNVAHGSIKANLLLNDFTYTPLGILDKTHLHFYTAQSIAQFLTNNGLIIADAAAVTQPLDGWQPHPLNDLPKEIASFIIADKQSHIMQYVINCLPESNPLFSINMQKLNRLVLDKRQKANIIFKIKRLIITKMPFLLKCLEIISLRR